MISVEQRRLADGSKGGGNNVVSAFCWNREGRSSEGKKRGVKKWWGPLWGLVVINVINKQLETSWVDGFKHIGDKGMFAPCMGPRFKLWHGEKRKTKFVIAYENITTSANSPKPSVHVCFSFNRTSIIRIFIPHIGGNSWSWQHISDNNDN